jgi:hypothetical protein
VTCDLSRRGGGTYSGLMSRLTRILLSPLLLGAAPVLAQGAGDEPVPTGITGVGLSVILFTVAAAVLLTLVFRASARHAGRWLTARNGRRRVRRQLKARGRNVRHDFLLPGAYGGLARIDHAVLTSGGILCLRAIHGDGTVAGTENDPQWILVDGSSRRRFLNPLIQNEGRTRALRKALPEVPVANVVVFTGKVGFETAPPANVIPLERLDSYIAKYVFGPSRITDWDAVWLSLNAAVLDDAAARKDFAAQISFS